MPDLETTHESAAGFRKYLSRWYAPNYAYRDNAVGVWAFHDTADEDLDRSASKGVQRGVDAVLASWHSSHGGTRKDGVYTTWMGTNWSNHGWVARSDRMALGGEFDGSSQERLRYMFWDTCSAVRFSHGHSPARTWTGAAKGIRMVFGWDTPSIDSAHYGQYFWEEWNKNKSLSTAFLDASWKVLHEQVPAVAAFGATESEAVTRRDRERYLYSEAVSSDWVAWKWYELGKTGSDRQTSPTTPASVRDVDIVHSGNSDGEVERVAQKIGVVVAQPRIIESRPFGMRAVRTKALTLTVDADGDYELVLTGASQRTPARTGTQDDEALVERARSLIAEFNLSDGVEIRFSAVRHTGVNAAAKGTTPGDGRIAEKTVIFDEVIDGLPFVDPDAGHIEITFDATSGVVKGVRSSVREPRGIQEQAAGAGGGSPAIAIWEAREMALSSVQQTAAPAEDQAEAQVEITHAIEPGSEEVGYYMIDGKAVPVYRTVVVAEQLPEARPREVIVPLARSR